MTGYGESRDTFYRFVEQQHAAMQELKDDIAFNARAEPLDRVIYGMTDTDEYRRECEDLVRRVDNAIGEPIIRINGTTDGRLLEYGGRLVNWATAGIIKSGVEATVQAPQTESTHSDLQWDGVIVVPLSSPTLEVGPAKDIGYAANRVSFGVYDVTPQKPISKRLIVGGARAVHHPDKRLTCRSEDRKWVLVGEEEIATHEHYNEVLELLMRQVRGEQLPKRKKPAPPIVDC